MRVIKLHDPESNRQLLCRLVGYEGHQIRFTRHPYVIQGTLLSVNVVNGVIVLGDNDLDVPGQAAGST